MLKQAIFNTSRICYLLGVNNVVLSPGSRNAPLTISFARNDDIKKWIIPDERSAGFIALGIAQESKEPVVLCCTSGTALLNYGPAIAEAYYREIPLIVMSADRPPELIDQRDGQTIRQVGSLDNHVKKTLDIPADFELDQDYYDRITEAIRSSQALPRGPIHLNFPFREPFYPTSKQKLVFSDIALDKTRDTPKPKPPFLNAPAKTLILVGQKDADPSLDEQLKNIESHLPILISPLSNCQINGIRNVDSFVKDQQELRPELLITTGLSVLSKNLKNFIRNNPPEAHWHFDPAGIPVDTFDTNPQFIKCSLTDFLKTNDIAGLDSDFYQAWKRYSQESEKIKLVLLPELPFSEMKWMNKVLEKTPNGVNLHLGNSMPVRYAEILGTNKSVRVYSNRGTSGIDGVTSTALGASLVSDKLNVLITGDLSFLYDRNAFFHNHTYENLRIIVSNNMGGGIFRLIEGPANLPELEEYFETRHHRTAKQTCIENHISYLEAHSMEELEEQLVSFFNKDSGTKLLEVFTEPEENRSSYNAFRSRFQ